MRSARCVIKNLERLKSELFFESSTRLIQIADDEIDVMDRRGRHRAILADDQAA
jgi:hypothetical protein